VSHSDRSRRRVRLSGGRLGLAGSEEVVEGGLDAGRHSLFRLTYPDAWVVVLLVWKTVSIWIANLSLEVAGLGLNIIANTFQVSPLTVGVEVDFDHAVGYSLLEIAAKVCTKLVYVSHAVRTAKTYLNSLPLPPWKTRKTGLLSLATLILLATNS
jgi:hypothetical protein